MSIKLLMPALSPTMEEGNIVKWHKKVGDQVSSGDLLAEIETDKATMEFEATEDGTIGAIIKEEGSNSVKVNSLIAVILEDGESADDIKDIIAEADSSDTPNVETKKDTEEPKKLSPVESKFADVIINKADEPIKAPNVDLDKVIGSSTKRVKATPLAKVMAKKANIDLMTVSGSGPNGRIIKKDIESIIANPESKSNNYSKGNVEASSYSKPNSSMRTTIAKRLLESKLNVPHYYLSTECNISELVKQRHIINSKSKGDYKITINDFIVKASAKALRDHPEINSSWMGDHSIYYNTVDISIAVAIDNGLITPIVRDADKKGLIDISNNVKELAGKARAGKLQPNEYQGGGFSISNLGMFGIDEFSAIINPPQSSILAVGAVNKKPVVLEDESIGVADILKITISADHRSVDGALAAMFLAKIKGYLENPVSILL